MKSNFNNDYFALVIKLSPKQASDVRNLLRSLAFQHLFRLVWGIISSDFSIHPFLEMNRVCGI